MMFRLLVNRRYINIYECYKKIDNAGYPTHENREPDRMRDVKKCHFAQWNYTGRMLHWQQLNNDDKYTSIGNPLLKMPSIRFSGSHCFNVQFSPLNPKYLACATSENLGFEGGGSLMILENDGSEHLKLKKIFPWSSGLLDVSWFSMNKDLLVTSSCDGSLQLWNISGSDAGHSPKMFKEHNLDVTSLDTNSHFIVSGSWDSTIKVWDITSSSSLSTLQGEQGIVHSVKWSRHFPNLLLSVSQNFHLVLWDKSCPKSSVHKVKVQNSESLDGDWSYFEPHSAVVCGSDGVIAWWDIRALKGPRAIVGDGHEALARIKCSPHHPDVVGTTSYNLSTGIWTSGGRSLMERIRHHSAFILGLDFNRNNPGEIADCGLDSLVHVFTPWSLFHFSRFHSFLKHKL